jgi:hypothetical protein
VAVLIYEWWYPQTCVLTYACEFLVAGESCGVWCGRCDARCSMFLRRKLSSVIYVLLVTGGLLVSLLMIKKMKYLYDRNQKYSRLESYKQYVSNMFDYRRTSTKNFVLFKLCSLEHWVGKVLFLRIVYSTDEEESWSKCLCFCAVPSVLYYSFLLVDTHSHYVSWLGFACLIVFVFLTCTYIYQPGVYASTFGP